MWLASRQLRQRGFCREESHEIVEGSHAAVRTVQGGLEEAIGNANGEITLKTTTIEAPARPPEVNAQELTKLRLENGMSQAIFAQVLNVSTKTVQSWEQGQRKPSQAALRLIQVFRQNPSGLLELVGMSTRNHGSR